MMNAFDAQSGHKTQSGRHTVPDWTKDVGDLAEQFLKEELFKKISGRSSKNFPGISENYLLKLNMDKVHSWAKSRLEEFKKMNLYSHSSITINNTKL